MKKTSAVLILSLTPVLMLAGNHPFLKGAFAMNTATANPAVSSTPATAARQDNARDFDFFIGKKWKIHNKRLKDRLKGSNEWIEFEATSPTSTKILNGLGNIDEYHTDFWPGFIGMSFRFYNPSTRTWSIYWASTRNPLGVLEAPVLGRFEGSRGVFEGPDVFEGKPIVVRYIWSRTDTPNPRWEQAFSEDGGKTWETNWVMDFTRMD